MMRIMRVAAVLSIAGLAGACDVERATGPAAALQPDATGATPSAVSLPRKPPAPVLTRINPTSAAPGVTIALYGRDLNPPGGFLAPRVNFIGGSYFPQRATFASNTELRVVVPPGRGTAQLQVDTHGGRSATLPFVYKTPSLATVSPASGEKGQWITLQGQGFGVLGGSGGFWVKFGDSQVFPKDWTDTRIVVAAPSDYGTGLIGSFILSVPGCASRLAGGGLLLKWSLPGCGTLIRNALALHRLRTAPGFVTREVPVTVYTPAGVSAARTFTYRVPVQNG